MKTQNEIVELIVVLAVVTLIAPFGADAQVTQRPIEDFLAVQGTFCFPDGQGGCLLFPDPPVPNFLAFRQAEPERCAVVDYAGLANRWLEQQSGGAISLETTVEGTVTERPVEFQSEFGEFVGREIHVRLHARNALTWVVEGCTTLVSDALLFGQRAPEVLAGADAALGEALLEVRYLDGEFGSEPGGPLADLVQLVAFPLGEQAIIALRFLASADGELHEAFGVPEGTLGRVTISAVSLVVPQGRGASPSATPGPALDDGVPVARIDLHATGR